MPSDPTQDSTELCERLEAQQETGFCKILDWGTPAYKQMENGTHIMTCSGAKTEPILKLRNPDGPEAAARIRALEAMLEWRDISSAPKDGTRFLAWGYLHDDGGPYEANGQSFMGEFPGMHIACWDEEFSGFVDCNGGGSYDGLTHWMPLPAPPLTGGD